MVPLCVALTIVPLSVREMNFDVAVESRPPLIVMIDNLTLGRQWIDRVVFEEEDDNTLTAFECFFIWLKSLFLTNPGFHTGFFSCHSIVRLTSLKERAIHACTKR